MTSRILGPDISLHAPHLVDLEVAQVLRRYVIRGEIDPQRAQQALDDHLALPLERYSHDVLVSRVWQLRQNLTAYDAAYVALAELLGATLLTRDGRIRRAPGHHADVEVF